MKKKFAKVISIIFFPILSFTLTLLLLLVRNGETSHSVWIGFGFIIAAPLVLGYFAIKKKIIGNWDISNRSQRPKALGILLLVEFVLLMVQRSVVTAETFQTLIFLFSAAIGFLVITLFWKISGHTMASAIATGVLVKWFGWVWWPVLLFVPVVGWARVVRRDHSTAQVVAGALYGWIITLLFL